MHLSIVIPAFNEEAAVGGTARACLAAAPDIAREAGLDGVEVVVVDDGSRDRTAAIVREIPGVRLVQHAVNRGYGSALLTGFGAAQGDLLAFLDADGTCDPRLFGPLARALAERGADIVSGSRMGAGNSMPRVRRLGNRMFAFLINLVSPQRIEDLASGMRVFKRSALEHLAPLPTGLHFTPAMSAKALFDGALSLIEVRIPYAERIGASKLSVLKDGLRFLRVLALIALSYRPFRFFGTAGLALLALAAVLGAGPIVALFDGGAAGADPAGTLAALAAASAGLALIECGLVAESAAAILHPRKGRPHPLHRLLAAVLLRRAWLSGAVLVAAAWLAGRTADTAAAALLALAGVLTWAFGSLQVVLRQLAERRAARAESSAPG